MGDSPAALGPLEALARSAWMDLDHESRLGVEELKKRIAAKCSDFPSNIAHAALLAIVCEELTL
jgi:hypothetical protein